MLHRATVYDDTFELLKCISSNPIFENFYLVGGTALALQIGHRISIDLDFFTTTVFDEALIIDNVGKFGIIENLSTKPQSLRMSLNGIKLDFFTYPYKFIEPPILCEGIRLLPIEKIGLMKLIAIGNRGAKKDFIDFYFLLKHHEVGYWVDMFKTFFPSHGTFHLFKSLLYFKDADLEPTPTMLEKVTWESVKNEITEKINYFLDTENF